MPRKQENFDKYSYQGEVVIRESGTSTDIELQPGHYVILVDEAGKRLGHIVLAQVSTLQSVDLGIAGDYIIGRSEFVSPDNPLGKPNKLS